MLAVTGRLNPQQFGSPASIAEDDAGQVVIDDNQTRRSMYIKVRRSQPVAMLQSFDAPGHGRKLRAAAGFNRGHAVFDADEF